VKAVPAYIEDRLVYRVAIGVLGSLAIIAAIGFVVLVFKDKTTPEALVALGSAAVGALVGLFAPSPVGKQSVHAGWCRRGRIIGQSRVTPANGAGITFRER